MFQNNYRPVYSDMDEKSTEPLYALAHIEL